MSDITVQPPAPPAPPAVPPTAFQPPSPGQDPVGSARITRNVPPKRVMVAQNSTVTYGGQSYGPGETFVMGAGPEADGLAMLGQVVIIEHDATDAWNGAEGEKIRKAAHAHLDTVAKADPNSGDKRNHDHGFVPYEHAAKGEPMSEQTPFRQQAAQEQMFHGVSADEHSKRQSKGGE